MELNLRKVAPADASVLAGIGPDREAYLGYGGDPAHNPTGGQEWANIIIERVRAAWWGRIIDVDGDLAGEVKLHHHNAADASARLAIGVFRPELRGNGLGRAVISRTLDTAFGSLGLHRVELRVLANNTAAIRCYAAAGFVHEGRLRDAARIGSGSQDDLVMAVLATDPRATQT